MEPNCSCSGQGPAGEAGGIASGNAGHAVVLSVALVALRTPDIIVLAAVALLAFPAAAVALKIPRSVLSADVVTLVASSGCVFAGVALENVLLAAVMVLLPFNACVFARFALELLVALGATSGSGATTASGRNSSGPELVVLSPSSAVVLPSVAVLPYVVLLFSNDIMPARDAAACGIAVVLGVVVEVLVALGDGAMPAGSAASDSVVFGVEKLLVGKASEGAARTA